MDFTYYFDDKFFVWIWHNFSFMMVAIPSFLGALLKLIAKLHPGVPSDEIMDLLKVFFVKPGTDKTVQAS